MMEEINLQTDAQEFLFYSYFGETWDSLKCKKEGNNKEEEDAIYVCFQRAYRDFCRTLAFDNEKKYSEDMSFARDVYSRAKMATEIEKLIDGPTDFDSCHSEICGKIVECAKEVSYLNKKKNNQEKFYYGQAQKWLNMTLKYMRMTGLWEDEFSKIDPFLHVPLDNLILKASLNKGVRGKIEEGQKGLFSDDAENRDCVYSDGAFKSTLIKSPIAGKNITWSRIKDYADYKTVQEAVKACIPDEYKGQPLKWENKVWLAASELE